MYTIIGGTLAMDLDLSITGELPVSADKMLDHAKQNAKRCLKTYRSWQAYKTRLAVVGGGPSVKDHLEELRSWDGDIWAINGAWNWCRDNGIKATFFASDPHPIVLQWAAGVERAILEISCDPSVFDLLKSADVYTFDADVEKGGIAGCASTATCAPHMAARMGYRAVTFFGCESSYQPNASHAYMDEDRKEQMLVLCNGKHYLTAPDLHLQAIALSYYLRELPEFVRCRPGSGSATGGGLLHAMAQSSEYQVVWLSQELADTLGKPYTPVVSPAYVSGAMAMADNLEAFA